MHIIDARWDGGIRWGEALEGHAGSTRKLLKGFDKQLDERLANVPALLRGAARFTLKKGVAALHATMGSRFGDEVEALAEVASASAEEIILANLSYDLSNTVGCSTFVGRSANGAPLHVRSLDWPFPGKLLKTHLMTFRVRGAPAGDYALVGWPGFFGALTGLAPGRFSVTVNYVVHAEESGIVPALGRAAAGAWPVPWALRMALDDCKSFKGAVKFLSEVPLLSPVLFTVAGTKSGEAVTIERGPDDYLQRDRGDGTTITTNHYASEAYEDDNVDLSETSSLERFEALESVLGARSALTSGEAIRELGRGWLADANTQHRCVMIAGEGYLVVQLPGARAKSVLL